jgi:carbon-monoxide dehydrogenase medium subunit
MIPVAFDYQRAESVDHAVALLTEHGDEAKLLAGGHSLLPLMKLRLATPAMVIDVGRLSALSYVRETDSGGLAIGALTRHCVVETDGLLQAHVPLLARAASQVGDPQVRQRGTIGGSLAHGDPASDLPAVILALGATLVVQGPDGTRELAATEFFAGFLDTALADDEMLIEVRVPKVTGAGWSFQKFNRRAQDWAIVGVAAVHDPAGIGTGVGLVNMDSRPVRAWRSEAAVADGAGAAEASLLADDGLEPPTDLQASVEYRRHLSHVLVRRALEQAGV